MPKPAYVGVCLNCGKFEFFNTGQKKLAEEKGGEHNQGRNGHHLWEVIQTSQSRINKWRKLKEENPSKFYKRYTKFFVLQGQREKNRDKLRKLDDKRESIISWKKKINRSVTEGHYNVLEKLAASGRTKMAWLKFDRDKSDRVQEVAGSVLDEDEYYLDEMNGILSVFGPKRERVYEDVVRRYKQAINKDENVMGNTMKEMWEKLGEEKAEEEAMKITEGKPAMRKIAKDDPIPYITRKYISLVKILQKHDPMLTRVDFNIISESMDVDKPWVRRARNRVESFLRTKAGRSLGGSLGKKEDKAYKTTLKAALNKREKIKERLNIKTKAGMEDRVYNDIEDETKDMEPPKELNRKREEIIEERKKIDKAFSHNFPGMEADITL